MSAPEQALDAVLARPDVWRGGGARPSRALPTGFDELDAGLGGGWPLGALIECLPACPGIGEMALFLPVLTRVTRTHGAALLDPPHLPYPPALAQAGVVPSRLLILRPQSQADWLWAGVQCLESGACRAVCLWNDRLDDRMLRRLQLAAEEGSALAVLFRPPQCAARSSPAALRIAVAPRADSGLTVRLLKCRGRAPRTIELAEAAPA